MLKEWTNKSTVNPVSGLFSQVGSANNNSQHQMSQSLFGSQAPSGLFNNTQTTSTFTINQGESLLRSQAPTSLFSNPLNTITLNTNQVQNPLANTSFISGNTLFQNVNAPKDKPTGSLFPALGTTSNSLLSGLTNPTQNGKPLQSSNLLQGLNQPNSNNQTSGIFSDLKFNQNKGNPSIGGIGTQNIRANPLFNPQNPSTGVAASSLFQNQNTSNLLGMPTQQHQQKHGLSNSQQNDNIWLGGPLNSVPNSNEKTSLFADLKPNSSLFTSNLNQGPSKTPSFGVTMSSINSQPLFPSLQSNPPMLNQQVNQPEQNNMVQSQQQTMMQNQQQTKTQNSLTVNNNQMGSGLPMMSFDYQQNALQAIENLALAFTQFVSMQQQNQTRSDKSQEIHNTTSAESEPSFTLRSLAGIGAKKVESNYFSHHQPYSMCSEEPSLGSSFHSHTPFNYRRNERVSNRMEPLSRKYPYKKVEFMEPTISRRNDENLTFLFKRTSSEEYRQTYELRKTTNSTFIQERKSQAELKETKIDSNEQAEEQTTTPIVEKQKPVELLKLVQKPLVSEEKIPLLTKAGYTIEPSLLKLSRMTEEELSAVENFIISNEFGKIKFEEPVDLRGLNLDKIVNIRYQEVEIYPEDYKPSEGEGDGLNKPATITFFKWEVAEKYKTRMEEYEKKLKKWCGTINAEFVGFNPELKEVTIHLNRV